MPAINDNSACLIHRSARFAGKPRSNKDRIPPVGARLPAINDNAACLIHRSARFAGKPRFSKQSPTCWSRACPRRTFTRNYWMQSVGAAEGCENGLSGIPLRSLRQLLEEIDGPSKPASVSDHFVGVMQVLCPVGCIANLHLARAGASDFVRMMATEQAAVGALDVRRFTVCLHP